MHQKGLGPAAQRRRQRTSRLVPAGLGARLFRARAALSPTLAWQPPKDKSQTHNYRKDAAFELGKPGSKHHSTPFKPSTFMPKVLGLSELDLAELQVQ